MELSRRTTLNSLRRRASNCSLVRLNGPVKRVNRGGSLAVGLVPPLQGGMRVSRGTAWGTRLGHSATATTAQPGLDLDMGQMSVQAI